MKRRLLISYLLIVFMVLAAACSGNSGNSGTGSGTGSGSQSGSGTGSGSGSGTSSGSGSGSGAASEGPKEIVELTAWSTSAPPAGITTTKATDTKIGKMIAEETGVSFTIVFTQGDAQEALNLRIASGEWDDIITHNAISPEWTDKLLKAGAIIPLDDYFNQPDKYPNLAKIPKEVLDNFRFTDGHIYQFPSQWYENMQSIYGYWAAEGWYANPKYLAAVNMTPDDLTTTEGVENFLKAVKAANLKTEAGLSVIPMSSGQNISFWKTVASSFGVSTTSMGWNQLADGNIVHFRDDPRLVEAMKWMNKLNREGLLDAELLSQTNEQLTEKLMNDRVALVPDAAWPFWGAVTAGPSPVTELLQLNFPKAPGVANLGRLLTYNPYGNSGVYVTTAAKDPDAVARYADWGSATGEYKGWQLFYGPLGKTWEFSKEYGEPYIELTDAELKEAHDAGDYAKIFGLGSAILVNITPFDLDLNYYRKEAEKNLFWIFNMHRHNTTQGYHTVIQLYDKVNMPPDGEWLTNKPTLDRIDLEYFAKLITAKSDGEFDNLWQEYRRQLEQQGRWEAVKAEWHEAYQDQAG